MPQDLSNYRCWDDPQGVQRLTENVGSMTNIDIYKKTLSPNTKSEVGASHLSSQYAAQGSGLADSPRLPFILGTEIGFNTKPF